MVLPAIRTGVSIVPLLSGTIKKFSPRMMAGVKNPIFQAIAIGEIVDTVQELVGSRGNDLSAEELAGIEDIAKFVGHILNDEGILWPSSRDGEPIPPRYLTINMDKGTAWFHRDYFSRKSLNASYKKGRSHGWRGRNARTNANVRV